MFGRLCDILLSLREEVPQAACQCLAHLRKLALAPLAAARAGRVLGEGFNVAAGLGRQLLRLQAETMLSRFKQLQ